MIEIKKFPFKVGDRVECVNRWVFDDRIQVGDRGYIDSIKNSGQVFVKFDKVYQLQQCSIPEEHLRKIEEKGEEKMIKVGDIVTVKCGKDTENKYGINSNMKAMERENKGYEVTDIRNGDVLVEVKDGATTWNFHINDVKLFNKGEEKKMEVKWTGTAIRGNCGCGIKFKKVEPFGVEKVIFNGPATILFRDGQKYVTKAYNEEFDAEKGLALAMLKSFGISYLDFKRILKKSNLKEENIKDEVVDMTHIIDEVGPRVDAVSPKGAKRGQPRKFFVGDNVVVRDCNYYKYTTNATAKGFLNQVLTIEADKSDFTGSEYVIMGTSFAGSELEPFKK